MPVDLVVKGGKLITPKGLMEAGVAIEAGKVVKVAKTPGLPEAGNVIDASGKFVLPGVIDAHCHLHDLDYTYRENFESGSRAAAAGGVTVLIDMPLVLTVLSRMIRRKIEIGERESIVDFTFHAGMMKPDYVVEMPEITANGVRSFKVFTTEPFRVDWGGVRRISTAVKELDGVMVVHAEEDELVSEGVRKVKEKEGRKDVLAYFDSRPAKAEVEAVRKLVTVAEETGAHVHVAHVTTGGAVELLSEAKERGLNVSAETCPQYLVFTRDDAERLGPYLKMTPPLRTKTDVATLWEALKDGRVDMVATDHAPGTREEKEVGFNDIWNAWGGIPGVETMLPILLSEGVNKDRLSLQDLCKVLCERPAKVFHLYPRKGALLNGSDGDLVVIDLKKEVTLNTEILHYKVNWTPFEGMNVVGYPVLTVQRGEVIAKEGEVLGTPGQGRFVPMR